MVGDIYMVEAWLNQTRLGIEVDILRQKIPSSEQKGVAQ